jgi:hypothetical protein
MPYDEHMEDSLNARGDAKIVVTKEAAAINAIGRKERIFAIGRRSCRRER